MPTLPTNPQNIGSSGHVNDHNTIVTSLSSAAYLSGTNVTNSAGTTVTWMQAWASYTPTWTNLTLGNGTVTTRYIQVGKTVYYYGKVSLGSTSTLGGSNVNVSLPVTAKSTAYGIGSSYYADAGVTNIGGICVVDGSTSTTNLKFYMSNSTSNAGQVGSTNPFTWGTSDAILWTVIYEAA